MKWVLKEIKVPCKGQHPRPRKASKVDRKVDEKLATTHPTLGENLSEISSRLSFHN